MMPSAYEGFPNTLLEAQSYGCAPVLFDSYRALDWIVQDMENTILIPPFETQIMADKVVDIICSEQKLRRLQQGALKNANRFTLPEVGKQWETFFEKITA